VERIRETAAIMGRTEHGHPIRVLLHFVQCDMSGDMDAGLGRTCMLLYVFGIHKIRVLIRHFH
jgi:hypothetical protein